MTSAVVVGRFSLSTVIQSNCMNSCSSTRRPAAETFLSIGEWAAGCCIEPQQACSWGSATLQSLVSRSCQDSRRGSPGHTSRKTKNSSHQVHGRSDTERPDTQAAEQSFRWCVAKLGSSTSWVIFECKSPRHRTMQVGTHLP